MIQLLNTKHNDEQFDCLFSRAEKIAERLEVDLKPKRRVFFFFIFIGILPSHYSNIIYHVGRQVHRKNAAPDTSPVSAHKLFFPFIDHVISEMERRFPDDLKNHMTGYYLIPY